MSYFWSLMNYDLLADQAFMEEVYAGDQDLAIETLREFLINIDEDYACLMGFYEGEGCSCEDVHKVLHRIKPSLYYVGLKEIYNETTKLMDMLRSSSAHPDRSFLNEYLDKLHFQIEQVRAYAHRF